MIYELRLNLSKFTMQLLSLLLKLAKNKDDNKNSCLVSINSSIYYRFNVVVLGENVDLAI